MKVLALCLAIFGLVCDAKACIWITGTKYQGGSVETSGRSGDLLLRAALKRDPKPDGMQMETTLRGATNYNDRSDYAVALMYLGQATNAVPMLEQLEKERSGEYFVAANLGTAYELAGQNEEALKWIKEGVRRNPNSHKGTEWLHVKILEAKIAAQKDVNYFKEHSVLELQPENLKEEIQIGDMAFRPKDLADAIQYQLVERLRFVKPPDAPVASLLFDYAAIEARTKTLESAKSILQMAVEYGYPKETIAPLVQMYDSRIAQRKIMGYVNYGLIALAAIGVLTLLYKAKIFVLSSRDLKRPG